jgi:CheY-like chemotaxis protein
MLLKRAGHEVRVAHDGLQAVEGAAAFQPDVILLDIGLPGLNGYEAARRIREQQRDKDLTLVAVTGWGQEEDRHRSEEAGFDAHIVKPVDFAALTRLLAEPSAGYPKR